MKSSYKCFKIAKINQLMI